MLLCVLWLAWGQRAFSAPRRRPPRGPPSTPSAHKQPPNPNPTNPRNRSTPNPNRVKHSHAIVSSAVGPEYYVSVRSFVDKTQLEPGCSVLLHNKARLVVICFFWRGAVTLMGAGCGWGRGVRG